MALPIGYTYIDCIQRILGAAGLTDPLSVARDPNTILWHYTSMDSFDKIVCNHSIRLSPIDRMNDYQEGRWLWSSMFEKHLKRNTDKWFFDRARMDDPPDRRLVYSFSLSAANDRLSQWRAYADSAHGIAIGFELGDLMKRLKPWPDWSVLNSPDPATTQILVPVQYDEGVQQKVIDELFAVVSELNADYIALCTNTPPGPHFNRTVGMTFALRSAPFYTALQFLEPLFKNPAFCEEKEWRFIYFSQPHGSAAAPGSPKRGFRSRRDDLLPYFEFDISRTVSSVATGALCLASEDSLTSFFNDNPDIMAKSYVVMRPSKASLVARL